MNPEVSVIIPNYNHAPFLKERLDSVLNQTFKQFEVIILDDCSTDNSRQIIEAYRNNKQVSKIVYNETNSGSPFKQWQKGIQLASGRFIWIAESDDYCHDTFLESALKTFEKSDHSLHYCQSYNVDEHNKIIENNFRWTDDIENINWHHPFVMNGTEFIKKALQFKNVIPNASAVVFMKKEIDFTEIIKYKTAGDWLFWVKMLVASNVSYSNEILNNFRSHTSTTRFKSTHKKFLLRHFEILSIKHQVCDTYKLISRQVVRQYLKICIDICRVVDIRYFIGFCREFNLPSLFIAHFIMRKLLVNRYMNSVRSLKSAAINKTNF